MGKQVWCQDWCQGSRAGNDLRLEPDFFEGKNDQLKVSIISKPFPGLTGQKDGDGRESLMTAPNYNTPVKDLVYKDLLTRTFTLASHDRGMKTWSVLVSYPECVFFRNKFRYELYSVECHMDPNIGKVTTGKERTVVSCKESLPTSRGPHRNRFLEIQTEIRSHIIGRTTKRLCLQKRLQR
jgi:hypothetical protein